MKYFLLITSLLILPFTLFASQDDLSKSKGTTQDVIVHLMPSPAQEDVSRYTKIEVSFNIPLDVKHVKKFDVKLKCISCKTKKNIKGKVNYSEADKKVSFTPAESLTPGVYEVEFKSLKADKAHKKTKIKEIKYRFVVPTLVSLTLETNTTSLNLGEKAQLGVTATYDNNVVKDVTDKVEWLITPTDIVKIQGKVLTALKDTDVAVQAKLETILSNIMNLEIYWEVNGHRLPPEPDPTVNNSTLLGIDVNDNGVRDDVERWIYETYKDKHPIHIDIAMQAGKAYKKVLETPERAKEIHDEVSAPLDCELYYRRCKAGKELHFIDRNEKINSNYFRKNIYFNTKDRIDKYWQYDTLLSGDSYTIPWCSERKQLCDFNTTKYE